MTAVLRIGVGRLNQKSGYVQDVLSVSRWVSWGSHQEVSMGPRSQRAEGE